MATLADALRGYVPPTESPMSDVVTNYTNNIAPQAQANLLRQTGNVQNAIEVTPDLHLQVKDPQAFNEFMNEVPNLANMVAYHGTPHNIQGAFDISKVGTGEGAQAYGHGMYFAEAPQVAETYKRAGGGLEVKYAKPLEELGINPDVASRSMDFDQNPVNQALGRIAKGLKTTALDYPEIPLDKKLVKEHFDEYIRLLEDKYPKDAAQKKALQDLVAKEGYPDINFGGNLYKVDIPDEHISMMLDYDKPIKDQPALYELVRKSIKDPDILKTFEHNAEKGITGANVYKNYIGGKTDAQRSENALNMGIKGISYLDEGSRGLQTGIGHNAPKYTAYDPSFGGHDFDSLKEAEKFVKNNPSFQLVKPTSNFVVFDPSTVKILEENGKPLTRKELIEKQVKDLKD